MGDRWQDPGLAETKTIIFPITFNGSSVSLDYRERFDINFVTGEWRETPTEGLFADRTKFVVKTKSNEHASYLAKAAIDGDVDIVANAIQMPETSCVLCCKNGDVPVTSSVSLRRADHSEGTRFYASDGRRVTKDYQGVKIVKRGDGTVVKCF